MNFELAFDLVAAAGNAWGGFHIVRAVWRYTGQPALSILSVAQVVSATVYCLSQAVSHA